MAEAGQYQVLLTFFGALVVGSGLVSDTTAVSVCLVIGNLGVTYLLMYFEGAAWLEARREAQRESGLDDADAEGGDDDGKRGEGWSSVPASVRRLAVRLWACLCAAARSLHALALGAQAWLARQRRGDGDGDNGNNTNRGSSSSSSSKSSSGGKSGKSGSSRSRRGDEESQTGSTMLHAFYAGRSGADAVEMAGQRGGPTPRTLLGAAAAGDGGARSPAPALNRAVGADAFQGALDRKSSSRGGLGVSSPSALPS
jgi:hypothetical protein